MFTILIVAQESSGARAYISELTKAGYTPRLASDLKEAIEGLSQQPPHLVIFDLSGHSISGAQRLLRKVKEGYPVPLLIMLPQDALLHYDPAWGAEDFILQPCSPLELTARVKQILWRSGNVPGVIKCGDLVIDPTKYQVSVAGRRVALTLKEYELLKFLASQRGKAFSRETLLNKVWGYDYYGGDRTVDVHIRRLRSKIEDRGHSFIDTVRGIGYRFQE